jgi:hypothetical protein
VLLCEATNPLILPPPSEVVLNGKGSTISILGQLDVVAYLSTAILHFQVTVHIDDGAAE